MSYKNLKSFKIKNYKCFIPGNPYQGFDEIKPINIIIGKNNSGKSKILEFLRDFIESNNSEQKFRTDGKVYIEKFLEKSELGAVFRQGHSGGEYSLLANNGDHWEAVGRRLLHKKIVRSDEEAIIEGHDFILNTPNKIQAFEKGCRELKDRLQNPFEGYGYLAIQAERDLKKEGVNFNNDNPKMVRPDGGGLTELIVRCLNEEKGHEKGWQSLIEKELLEAINSVLAPDLTFTRIYTKIEATNTWEIYLEEQHKGGIKLSDCGSGIKTIIFAMVMLYVAPKFKDQKKFVFAFEELENNLHPSLERKLLAHIRDYIKDRPDNLLFITTHSNVAIDMFSKNGDAQILRAYNDGKGSFIERVDKWDDHHNLLNDLGVKASDVLQANCLIWMEGPSDRIYFNKWIELFNDGEKLEEDLHYQCVFYGGSTLSHFSVAVEPTNDRFIQMVKINRNGVVLMDSDKNNDTDTLKPRVLRVVDEIKSRPNVLAWVTDGREIENYIPKEVLNSYFGKVVRFQKYTSLPELYKRTKDVSSFDKVQFASEIVGLPSYSKENLENELDLKSKIGAVIDHIRLCNS